MKLSALTQNKWWNICFHCSLTTLICVHYQHLCLEQTSFFYPNYFPTLPNFDKFSVWTDSPHGSVSGLPSGSSHLPSGESQLLSELVLLRHLLVLSQAAPTTGRSVHLAQLVEGKHRLPAGRRWHTSFIHPRSSRRLQHHRLGSGLLAKMKVTSGFKLAELFPLLLTFERVHLPDIC